MPLFSQSDWSCERQKLESLKTLLAELSAFQTLARSPGDAGTAAEKIDVLARQDPFDGVGYKRPQLEGRGLWANLTYPEDESYLLRHGPTYASEPRRSGQFEITLRWQVRLAEKESALDDFFTGTGKIVEELEAATNASNSKLRTQSVRRVQIDKSARKAGDQGGSNLGAVIVVNWGDPE